eukprot:TRINITY_DN37923_c0_g1_i1.p1 TRINITY_DN37923_c0_g1~~TRINITY_DN37923_c0_g1_i1.p1  ORF type:complete len:914 (+),score=171.20 TRINITY_DN37923_c0_g1_i1:70-2811(+)
MGNVAPTSDCCLGSSGSTMAILAFCDWQQRSAAVVLSRSFRVTLGLNPQPNVQRVAEETSDVDGKSEGAGYWRFLCYRLAEENQIYAPVASDCKFAPCPPAGIAASWQKLFEELYKLARDVNGDREKREEVFSINVAARFRSPQTIEAKNEGDAIVLPLHQKVQLVRNRLGCSANEAMKLIMRERAQKMYGNDAFEKPASDIAGGIFQPCVSKEARNKENVSPIENKNKETIVKEVQPSSGLADCCEHSVNLVDARCSILAARADTSTVLAVTRQSGLKEYCFDRVFDEASTQENVYESSARRLVMEFLNGRSASIVCYGQTASGKTFTMFGPSSTSETHDVYETSGSFRGIVPRACDEVLGAAKRWRERGDTVQIGVSYVEIFGSEISDLLREGCVVGQNMEGRYGAVRATDRVGHRYVLDGQTQVFVETLAEVEALLRAGESVKRRAATAMNERSTRAHTIFVISLALHPMGTSPGITAQPRKSRFFFADLGGSEQLTKSQAGCDVKAVVTVVGGEEQSRLSWNEYYQHRQRIQETLNINKGLFSLKRVIEALHRRSRLSKEGTPQNLLPYVPYQDSKLTMLLQEALGGSARTMIVVTATMDPGHAVESIQTLRFADTCAQVQKRREQDEAASVRVALGQVAAEIETLETAIVKKERWETRMVLRADVDTVAGAFGEGAKVEREERVLQTVLVGAEEERTRLEHLLQRQAELQGLNTMGGLGKDFRDMKSTDAADGGRGVDFRQRDRFSAKMRARDFETEHVLADAVRFLFRKARSASVVFGETKDALSKRLPPEEIPSQYFQIATALRRKWEDSTAAGQETRPFGKAMMDQCQLWHKTFKKVSGSREQTLQKLIVDCNVDVAESMVGVTDCEDQSNDQADNADEDEGVDDYAVVSSSLGIVDGESALGGV